MVDNIVSQADLVRFQLLQHKIDRLHIQGIEARILLEPRAARNYVLYLAPQVRAIAQYGVSIPDIKAVNAGLLQAMHVGLRSTFKSDLSFAPADWKSQYPNVVAIFYLGNPAYKIPACNNQSSADVILKQIGDAAVEFGRKTYLAFIMNPIGRLPKKANSDANEFGLKFSLHLDAGLHRALADYNSHATRTRGSAARIHYG